MIIRCFANVLRLLAAPLWLLVRFLRRPKGSWVYLRIQPRSVDLPVEEPLWKRLINRAQRRKRSTLYHIRLLVEQVGRDRRIEGLAVGIPLLSTGWAKCAELRELLKLARLSGKQVVAYLPQGGANREIYVASAADRVLLGPRAVVSALGLAVRSLYFRPLLDRLGVEAQVQARGRYKTAAEGALLESMSEPQREQLQAVLQVFQQQLEEALLERPGFDRAKVGGVFQQGLLKAASAVELGVADGLGYEDELPKMVSTRPDHAASFESAERYFRWKRAKLWRPVRRAPYIAVVPVRGVIGMEDLYAEEQFLPGSTLVSALRQLQEDSRALGVVLHVNSPGGSALASDRICREVAKLAEKKPVVACLGEVAASGGYYVAAPAHKIVAQGLSITGSIGVVSAKLVAERLLERAGLRSEVVRMTPHADMFSPARGLDEEELRMVESEAEAFYQAFLEVVARGRGKSIAEIHELGQGRIWSGVDAARRGLADCLGGLDTAVQETKKLLVDVPERIKKRLEPRQVRLESRDLPPPEFSGTWVAPLAGFASEWFFLARLALGRERFLYYAWNVPRID